MRKQFIVTVAELMARDSRVVLLLGDIGVFGFRNVFAKYPERIFNLGILEQSCVSLAAGLAKEGLIPIFHSIAPFVVERAFEQIKIDFGYQNLGGTFVSVGASYDYASLGCTHHCPGDVALMKTVPNMQVFVPGAPEELDAVLKETFTSAHPKYIRLSEMSHGCTLLSAVRKAIVVREGVRGTVVTTGPCLKHVADACQDLDVTLIYYIMVEPFDAEMLRTNSPSDKILVVEPFYVGTLTYDVISAFGGRPVSVKSIGVPRQFRTAYGTASSHDLACGLTKDGIFTTARRFFYDS
jgi:transketolase